MSKHLDGEIKKTTVRFIIAGLLLLAAAIALSVIWNRSIKDELAVQSSSFVRKIIVSKEMRGVVEYLSGVQFSAFESVTLWRPSGEHIITLPPVMDQRERENSLWRFFLYGTIETKIFLDTEGRNLVATANYSYSRFELAPYAFVIWLMASLLMTVFLHQTKKKVEAEFNTELRARNSEIMEQIAKKVRHNIRSPLAVLKAVFVDMSVSREEFYSQGRGSVLRLEEIVSELKGDFSAIRSRKAHGPAIYEVTNVLKSITGEKQLIPKNVTITFKNECSECPVYSELSAAQLRATLSNLIDNSLQAISGAGSIDLLLDADPHAVTIELRDNGCGIPEDIIHRVFDQEFTHGKAGGTGLGLYYAKNLVESHQGNIEVHSEVGKGTRLTMTFPRVATPSWHLTTLKVSEASEVAVCDDQATITHAWRDRLNSAPSKPTIRLFSSCEEMAADLDLTQPRLYLVDYDLGQSKLTGLGFLKSLNSADQFVLVTGHFDDPAVQEECATRGCKLLSKDDIFHIEFA